MLKAVAGDKMIFGLSAKNIEKLQEGKPIKVDLKDLGREGFVYIIYGNTEQDIAKELGIIVQ